MDFYAKNSDKEKKNNNAVDFSLKIKEKFLGEKQCSEKIFWTNFKEKKSLIMV